MGRKDSNVMDKIKVHARVTREIEVTTAEANLLLGLSRGSLDEAEEEEARKVLARFTEGIDAGNYEAGYIPAEWLSADLNTESQYLRDVDL